jgi:hypothetical protein
MKKFILIISLVVLIHFSFAGVSINHLKRDLNRLPKNEKTEFKVNSVVGLAAIVAAPFTSGLSLLAIPVAMIVTEKIVNKPPKRKMPKCK